MHFSERKYQLDPRRPVALWNRFKLFYSGINSDSSSLPTPPTLYIINMQVGLLNDLPLFLLAHLKFICDVKQVTSHSGMSRKQEVQLTL